MKKFIFQMILLVCVSFFTLPSSVAQTVDMSNGVMNMTSNQWIFRDPQGFCTNYNYEGVPTEYVQTFVYDVTRDPDGPASLYINFTSFALNPKDTLFIYDGANETAPLIGAFSGVNNPYQDEDEPGIIISSGNQLTFKFVHTGQTVNGMNVGWRALVTPYWEAASSINLDAISNGSVISAEQFSCNMNLYDNGGATGNMTSGNYEITISSTQGNIKIETEQFNIGSGTMEIFDGNHVWDPDARRIGYFKQGYNPPPVFFSSGYDITFKITGGSGAGFHFALSCVPEIFRQDPVDPCPKIEIGDASQRLRDPLSPFVDVEVIEGNAYEPVILLEAKAISPGKYTGDYKVEPIPYPYGTSAQDDIDNFYGNGELTSAGAATDDRWLPTNQLTPTGEEPFSFAFFGTNYTQVTPGTNAALCFTPRSGSESWSFNEQIPNTGSPTFSFHTHENSIMGVYQDTYPGAGSPPPNSGVYYGHAGEYPCRTFVNSNYRLPQYSCTSDNNNTYKIIMYEGTNTIDIIIRQRTRCYDPNNTGSSGPGHWNYGSGLAGILNSRGNQAVVPPGRNTGPWTTTFEAWRFTPITPPDYKINWYEGAHSDDSDIDENHPSYLGSGKILPLETPRETMWVTAQLVFETSSDITYKLYDRVKINVDVPEIDLVYVEDSIACLGDAIEVHATTVNPDAQGRIDSVYWSYELDRFGDITNPFRNNNGDTINTENLSIIIQGDTLIYGCVYFDNGFYAIDSINVYMSPTDSIFLTASDTVICQGETVHLSIETEAFGFEWDQFEGNTNSTISVTPHDDIFFSVTGLSTPPTSCLTYDTVQIRVNPNPNASFVPNPPMQYVEDGRGEIIFQNLSTPNTGLVYEWNYGDQYCIPVENTSTDVDGFHNYTNAGRYTVTLVASSEEGGCIDSTSTIVKVEVPYHIYFPNSFTPNGDGINDVFAIEGTGVSAEGFEFQIFNRNGELIFLSQSRFDYWDGKNADGTLAPMGVYVYKAITQNMDGIPKTYTGTITLIR